MRVTLWAAGLLAATVVFGLGACLRRQHEWSSRKLQTVNLDGLVDATVPADLRYDPEATVHEADSAEFTFLRVNGHHWNGMTSYAEGLRIRVVARDIGDGVFDRIVKRSSPFGPRDEVRTEADGPMTWQFSSFVYQRDPVTEPAWRIRLIDGDAGLILTWWGYRKQYTLETARQSIDFARSRLDVTGDLQAYLRKYRDWQGDHPETTGARNLRLLEEALRELGLPPAEPGQWTRRGDWQYLIDDERPRQFHLVRSVAHHPTPEGPIHLNEPLTLFRYVQGTWWQNSQVVEAGNLPSSVTAGLEAEMTDRTQTYFYRIHSLNLWKEHAGTGNPVLNQLREWMRP
jgi:hypothetical protein